MRTIRWVGLGSLLCTAACVPYTVGSMAQTVPVDEVEPSWLWYSSPWGLEGLRDSTLRFLSTDIEGRWGITDRMDAGVRLASLSGIVFNVKQRLNNPMSHRSGGVSVMPGIGVLSAGQYLHFEMTVLASGHQNSGLTPYGGLRIMQEARLSNAVQKDASPTYGGFAGLRIGKPDIGVSMEVGVFHDRPMLGSSTRTQNVVVIPAIVLHGKRLIDAITGVLRPRPY